MAPDAHYSAAHKHLLYDLTFANGHHPFGALSNCSALSPLHADLYLRNLVVSNIEAAAASLTVRSSHDCDERLCPSV